MANREIVGATGGATYVARPPKVTVRGSGRQARSGVGHSRQPRRGATRAGRGPGKSLRSLPELLDGARSAFSRREGPGRTYDYLKELLPWGREEQGGRDLLVQADWSPVIQLLTRIRRSGERRPFKPGFVGPTAENLLGDWLGVHWNMAVQIAHWLREDDALAVRLHARHGDQILGVMRYLLGFVRQELPGRRDGYSAAKVTKTRDALFRAFVGLARVECRTPEGRAAGIPPRLKDFGEAILRLEGPCHEMSARGRHVSDLYALDAAWVREMVPRFFPPSASRGRYFVAAWERFLSADFHPGMFSDPVFRRLYRRGLGLTADDAYDRELRDPEDGIVRHFATAYLYVDCFGFGDALFRRFREGRSRARRGGFVDRVGEIIREPPRGLPGFAGGRLTEFWEWMLEDDADPDVLARLGQWGFLPSGLFGPGHLARLMRGTLEKAAGRLDDPRGLRLSVGEFAEVAPHDAIAILERFFGREWMCPHSRREGLYLADRDPWDAAVERLRRTPGTAERARALGRFLRRVVSRHRPRQGRRAAAPAASAS